MNVVEYEGDLYTLPNNRGNASQLQFHLPNMYTVVVDMILDV